MRVALFGGSFNPPHIGHQFVGMYVLETQPVDELWLLPTFQHPFDKPLESFADRFAMCRLAAAALGPRARVSDIEAQLAGQSRTLRTVQRLIRDWPGVAFSLVIGADLVAEVDSWFGGDELRKLVPFIVVNRGGHAAANSPLVAMPSISSTAVREGLKAGRNVGHWVPRTVLDYIRPRGLYESPAS